MSLTLSPEEVVPVMVTFDVDVATAPLTTEVPEFGLSCLYKGIR